MKQEYNSGVWEGQFGRLQKNVGKKWQLSHSFIRSGRFLLAWFQRGGLRPVINSLALPVNFLAPPRETTHNLQLNAGIAFQFKFRFGRTG
jgi:hypothetical protein